MITVREGVGILHKPCEILSIAFFFLELSGSITGTYLSQHIRSKNNELSNRNQGFSAGNK